MNAKIEIVAMVVRILADKNVIQKPDAFTELLTNMFGGESYDKRLATEIVEDAENAAAAIKKMNTNRKFKKIVKNA